MPETSVSCNAEALRKQVEERAYALWESEGGPHGRDFDHWCQAEAEVMPASDAGAGSDRPKPAAAQTRSKNKKKAADIAGATSRDAPVT